MHEQGYLHHAAAACCSLTEQHSAPLILCILILCFQVLGHAV
jgi:hypothetical protein